MKEEGRNSKLDSATILKGFTVYAQTQEGTLTSVTSIYPAWPGHLTLSFMGFPVETLLPGFGVGSMTINVLQQGLMP